MFPDMPCCDLDNINQSNWLHAWNGSENQSLLVPTELNCTIYAYHTHSPWLKGYLMNLNDLIWKPGAPKSASKPRLIPVGQFRCLEASFRNDLRAAHEVSGSIHRRPCEVRRSQRLVKGREMMEILSYWITGLNEHFHWTCYFSNLNWENSNSEAGCLLNFPCLCQGLVMPCAVLIFSSSGTKSEGTLTAHLATPEAAWVTQWVPQSTCTFQTGAMCHGVPWHECREVKVVFSLRYGDMWQ